MNQEPKVAIFYDWLNQWGGAERVLLNIIKLFPKAPVFTLIHNPKKTHWLPKKIKIITSFVNKLPFSQKNPIFYTPLYSTALEQFDFSQYDIVISTTSISGHCLITSPKTLFVCYLHNINRYVHQTPKQFNYLKPLLNWYKKIDFIYGQRPDYLLCNSNTVKQRILENYHRPSSIVYPGVNISFFTPGQIPSIDKYFLVVSRLVKHKRIDLAIKTCQKLNKKLIIVGQGRDKKDLIKLVKKPNDHNIIFLGKVKNKKLKKLYQNCQALICPQIEDFGLTPLEAQACGKPVIALKKGGITETVINGKTGIFFKNQTIKSLSKAIQKFDSKNFSSTDCVANATKFSTLNFMLNFRQTINSLWQQYQTTTL
jgi:glycosyltransferase involved in cell wall biosynthesis